MEGQKGFFRRYWRTIGVFVFWLFLLVIVFGIQKEEVSALNFAICLVFLAVLEFVLGYGQDKAEMESDRRKLELERRQREALGEEAWNDDQLKKKVEKKSQDKVAQKGMLLDFVMGCVYLAVLWLVFGEDPKWLKDAVPAVLWFLVAFPILAIWIITFPQRKREGKIFIWELLFIGPFFMFPFLPLLSGRMTGVYSLFTLGWCFSVMAVGYMCQERREKTDCTVMTTAKVIGNVKSPIFRKQERAADIPTYTFQPVVEYFADGQQRQIICDDGQPKPLPVDEVYGIYYNPGNPDEFRFAEHRTVTERFVGPLFLGIGILLLAIALGILVLT